MWVCICMSGTCDFHNGELPVESVCVCVCVCVCVSDWIDANESGSALVEIRESCHDPSTVLCVRAHVCAFGTVNRCDAAAPPSLLPASVHHSFTGCLLSQSVSM